MSQLRPHMTLEKFQTLFLYAFGYQHYKLFGFFNHDFCVALIGMRPYCDFVRGKHLYVDDLVVHENYRSQGLGNSLIKWIDSYAERNGYDRIRLSTGHDNVGAKNFYLKNDYKNKAIVFVKNISSIKK